MPVLIVEASALGALIFGEPQAGEISERLSEGIMVAPALIWFELASICLKKKINYHRPCRWFWGTTTPDLVIRCCPSRAEVALLLVDLRAVL